ncbi:MAG: recombinase A [Proteobacteria bacterium]|nr:recombinase A [Pseudomonadota bacterium]
MSEHMAGTGQTSWTPGPTTRGGLLARTGPVSNSAQSSTKIRELFAGTAVRLVASQQLCQVGQPHWNRELLSGRLTEISGVGAVASLTSAIGLVLDAQIHNEPVAWVSLPTTSFYPPDVADSGVDLDALVVVRVSAGQELARAADRLARSGAFGLIVLDMGRDARISTALQGRLIGLAKRHDTAIVCLTQKSSESASLGSMVSLRTEVLRERGSDGHFRCNVSVLKDKRRGPNWNHSEVVRAPAGLR